MNTPMHTLSNEWKQEIVRGTGDDPFVEIFVTRPMDPGISLRENILRAHAHTQPGVPVKLHCFYPAHRREEARDVSLRNELPLMLTESDGSDSTGGVFVHAVRGIEVQTLEWEGRPVGLAYRHHGVDYCYLCDIRGGDGGEAEQTRQVFDAFDTLLQRVGMTFQDVLRTWFYNRDILGWYQDFNRVRTAVFQKHAIFDHLIPASTGIGANNPFDAALMAAAFAVRDPSGHLHGREVPSPLQCPATDYGSSFSRAVRFDTDEHSRLTLSGTASIDRTGETVFVGDVEGQVRFTHEVVGEILKAEGFDWSDVVRGIAYFRRPEDAERALDIPVPGDVPVLRTINVVCRDPLLYELEINAVKKK